MRVTVWDAVAQRSAPVLPELDAPAEADVVVVGMGGAGLSAALVLVTAGVDVLVLDGSGPGSGASGRNGGLLLGGLAPAHHEVAALLGAERAAELYRRTLDELAATAQQLPDVVRVTGSLRVARSADEEADCEAQLAAMRRDGLPVEPYDGPEGCGLLFAHDAGFAPVDRVRALAAAADLGGARLRTATVLQVSPGSVLTSAGVVTARRGVVVAVDGGLERLVPSLAGRVRAARLQMLATAPATDVRLDRPVYARWGLDYWQQLPDGRIALGGGRDVGGEPEWTTSATTSAPVQAHLERLLRQDLGTEAPVEHRWAGVVGFSDDSLPVLAQPAPGLLAVGGYSGTGNLVGPMAGRWAARTLLGRPDDLGELLAR